MNLRLNRNTPQAHVPSHGIKVQHTLALQIESAERPVRVAPVDGEQHDALRKQVKLLGPAAHAAMALGAQLCPEEGREEMCIVHALPQHCEVHVDDVVVEPLTVGETIQLRKQ